MKKLVMFTVTAFVLFLSYAAYLHIDISDDPTYVTSDNCETCHQANYDSWKTNTLHPYMFLPVTSPEQILGDFDSDDPAVTFKKEEIEFVLGSKWEQVYARIIDGEYYPFPAKWYVIEKRWVPYKVKDWHNTPMSYKCNGCHTTGFDPNTLEFAEFGIGCEACHGPGSLHVQQKRKKYDSPCSYCHGEEEELDTEGHHIIRSVSPSVCGQCHNRGKTPKGDAVKGTQFNFPIGFKPGGDIRTFNFNPSTPKNDKKGKFWWGNGLSKNRHQEFSDWSKSKHSKALQNMLEKHADREFKDGPLEDKCLHCHSTDYRNAPAERKPTLDTATFGVTCVVCHEPHGHDKERPGFGDGTTLCGGCHVRSMAVNGEPHFPCPIGAVSCADCHMPLIVKTGGFFSLRSHAFGIVQPKASQGVKMPNSCQNGGCHEDRSLDWAIQSFSAFYPNAEE